MSYHNKIKHVDLEQFNHNLNEYDQSWESCDQYAYNVLSGIEETNKQIKNSCARYVYDRTCRDDIEFRTQEITDVISFTNKLRHVKGKISGQPMLLMMWQIFILGNIFGWYYTKGDSTGERRFSKALTIVARGNAKSTLLSVISLYTLLTSPNGSPSTYSAARTAKQASIVFNDAKKMIRSASWEIACLFEVKMYEIICPINDGEFRALASEAQSVDGLRVALAVLDELHSHVSSDMLNTLTTGTSATVDPLIFCITTAGSNLESVSVNERNLLRDINADIEQLDTYFGVEYSIDPDDDWTDELSWKKANPSLGHAVNINVLRSECSRAKQTATNRKDFLTKYCCIWVNIQDSPYIDISEMQINCAKKLSIQDYIGRECYIGLDLAQRFDLAALALLFPEEDGSLTAFLRHYCAYGALKKLTASKYEMYLQWEEDGHLILTDGHSTDFEYIKDDIRWAAKAFDLKMVGYDPYSATQLALQLEKENGIEMVEVRQSFAQLSEPSKLFQTLVANSMFNYQDTDKCFEWNVSNAVCSTDKNENIKVHKATDKPHDKVDSVIAVLTGLNPESLKEPKTKNPYRKRGMIIL